MQQTIYSYLIILVLLTTACTKTEEQHPTFIPSAGATGWLVPTEQIVFNEGARDQIMAIDEPVFYSFEEASLEPNEKVFICQANDHVAIYPLEILWHYEIVNDVYQDHYVAVTYCPLTGSGIAWDRTINGKPTTFGVSGHLYNHNLVPYDRATERDRKSIRVNFSNLDTSYSVTRLRKVHVIGALLLLLLLLRENITFQ
ncbi:MAG: DUF3179 domain-containing protein [Bacteroidales bacterium]|nr:DUF3179 domain-containing protein [Bacteroidales bacterium]